MGKTGNLPGGWFYLLFIWGLPHNRSVCLPLSPLLSISHHLHTSEDDWMNLHRWRSKSPIEFFGDSAEHFRGNDWVTGRRGREGSPVLSREPAGRRNLGGDSRWVLWPPFFQRINRKFRTVLNGLQLYRTPL